MAKVAEQRKKLKLTDKMGKARGKKPVQKPAAAEESTASPASAVDSEPASAVDSEPTASPAKARKSK